MPRRGHFCRRRRAGRPARLHRAQRRARQGVEGHHREEGSVARRRRVGRRQGQAPVPGALKRLETPGGNALPHVVARHLLSQHADRLPDLSGLTVLVPNHRAGQDFARALAQAAGRPVLVPPRITPLKSWADDALGTSLADNRAEPQARRLARLHGVLRHTDWLGKVDKWALANELLQLADELSAARLGGAIGSRIRALHADTLDRETALIEAVWQALNGSDPQARYARALDTLREQIAEQPQPIYGYALGTLTAIEQQFL